MFGEQEAGRVPQVESRCAVKTRPEALASLHKLGCTSGSCPTLRMSLLESLVHNLETTNGDGGAVPCGTCKANPLGNLGGKVIRLGLASLLALPCCGQGTGRKAPGHQDRTHLSWPCRRQCAELALAPAGHAWGLYHGSILTCYLLPGGTFLCPQPVLYRTVSLETFRSFLWVLPP